MLIVLQVNGHYVAKLDPLGIDQRPMPVELDLALYGFSDKDMDREYGPSQSLQLNALPSNVHVPNASAAFVWQDQSHATVKPSNAAPCL